MNGIEMIFGAGNPMALDHSAEAKAFRLHAALSRLLEAHKELIRGTNSEPTFGQPEAVTLAETALFDNRPLADWEPTPASRQRE